MCTMLGGAISPTWGNLDQATSTAPVIVMFGDSTTERGMPAVVKRALDERLSGSGLSPVMINAGKGYDNATSALGRLQKDVLSHKPNIVTISFGLNDAGGRKPEQFRASLVRAIASLREAGARVILMTSTPFDNDRHFWAKNFKEEGGLDEYMDREFCSAMRSLADGKNVLLCDLHTAFRDGFEQDSTLLKRVICGDGVHLTAEGKLLAAKHLAPMLETLILEGAATADGGSPDSSTATEQAVATPAGPGVPATIVEPGFEGDGAWKFARTGAGLAGLFSKPHADYIQADFIDMLPDRGVLFAYNNGPAHDIYQVLSCAVAANTIYKLSVVAIDATFANPFPGGELRLGYVNGMDDGTTGDGAANDFYGECLLKPIAIESPTPVNGAESDDGYETWTWSFATGDAPPGLGKPLRIELLGGGRAQSIFDNVALVSWERTTE